MYCRTYEALHTLRVALALHCTLLVVLWRWCGESFEYNLWLYRPNSSSVKSLEHKVLLKGGDPGLLEEWEEVSFLDWD
jgi:hypothetical protein